MSGVSLTALEARVARLQREVAQLCRLIGADDALVSTEEAGQVLGISRRAVLDRIHSGELPGVRVGRLWKVSRRQLLATVAAAVDNQEL